MTWYDGDMDNIILAAGLATRSNGEKLFYPWNGKNVLAQAADSSLAAGLHTIVVTGKWKERVEETLSPIASQITFVHNGRYEEGQFVSIQKGVEAIGGLEPFFITLGDLPLLTPEHYRMVSEALEKEWDGVQPFDKEKPGHPVLLRPYLAPFIIRADKQETMRNLLSRFSIRHLASDDAAFYRDIDTRQDWETLRK